MRRAWIHLSATAVLAVLAVLLATVPGHAQRLYKWVDEDGNVFYSDQIPPEQATERHQILDDRGLVRENVRRAKTPEELEEERRRKAQQAAREQAQREQARRDRVLLDTFSTERDLIIARDDRLASVDSSINLAMKLLTDAQSKYTDVNAELVALQNTRQPIPASLAIEHRRLGEEIRAHQQVLDSKQEERSALIAQFETDLERYRELKALRD